MKQLPLRTLLPAPPKDNPDSTQQQQQTTKTKHIIKRKTLPTVACENCRRRKTKCTGQRPSCAYCTRQKLSCHYSAGETELHRHAFKRKLDHIQQSNDDYKELFSLLQTAPETVAHDVFQRIRSGGDPAAILRLAHNGDLLLQLALSSENERLAEMPCKTTLPGLGS